MKQKYIKAFTFIFILSIVLFFAISFGKYVFEIDKQETLIQSKIVHLQSKVDRYVSQVNNNSRGETEELAKKVIELTRENENLRQENRDLKTQMEQLGWWKGK